MSTRSPQGDHTATLNLANLLQDPLASGGEVEASGSFMPDPAWHSDEVRFAEPLGYTVTARGVDGEDFVLSGRVSGVAIMPCRRCLNDVEVPGTSDFVFELVHRPGLTELEMLYGDEDSDEDEVLAFGRPEVDLAQFMTEIFAADLPVAVECPPGAGCVPLSEEHEQHAEAPKSPFSSLEDLDVES